MVYRLPRKPWPATLPNLAWDSVMKDDAALLRWLQMLETFGLVMVTGAPQETGHVMALAERVAFVKRTHYGQVVLESFVYAMCVTDLPKLYALWLQLLICNSIDEFQVALKSISKYYGLYFLNAKSNIGRKNGNIMHVSCMSFSSLCRFKLNIII